MPNQTICLDPGHGGRDPGAVGLGGLLEKEVNLAVCRLAAAELGRRGYQVMLTRTSDVTVSLEARAATANRTGAACFVSVHCNSAGNAAACGAETYYYPLSRRGKELAGLLQRELTAAERPGRQPEAPGGPGRPDRGIKPAHYYVLLFTTMPAALVELGFLSHPAEAALLGSPQFQARAAAALALGIEAFLKGRR